MKIEMWVFIVMFLIIAVGGLIAIAGWVREEERLELERHKSALYKEHAAKCREEIARLKSKIDVLELNRP